MEKIAQILAHTVNLETLILTLVKNVKSHASNALRHRLSAQLAVKITLINSFTRTSAYRSAQAEIISN